MEGVQVSCDTRYALLVHPRSEPLGPRDLRLLDLSIAFPVSGTVRGFTTRCRTRYCESAGNGSAMVLGLQFVELDSSAVQLLENFFATLHDA